VAISDSGLVRTDLPAVKHRWRWRRWALLAAGVLLLPAVVVLWILAATYQPVGFGGLSGEVPAGMPAATGVRTVNNAGISPGEIYVPPQYGAFTVGESIVNTGPEPVTIEAVTMVAPQQQAISSGWPLVPAGRVKWWIQGESGPNAAPPPRCSYAAPCPLGSLSLAPNSPIVVDIPVRLARGCYVKGAFSEETDFYVKEKFGPFAHWVTVPLGTPYRFQDPLTPGQNASNINSTSGVACP
jgi:hypothetical protein